MKKIFNLLLAMLAVCCVACEQLGGAHNGGNDNGDNSGDAPGTPGTTESVFNITVSDITSNSAYVSVETSSKETYYFDIVEKDDLDQYTNKNDYAEEYVSDYSLAAQKLSNNLNKRFCTVSRMMKQKQIKVAPQASKKAVTLSPKKAVVAKPASKTLVKRAIK